VVGLGAARGGAQTHHTRQKACSGRAEHDARKPKGVFIVRCAQLGMGAGLKSLSEFGRDEWVAREEKRRQDGASRGRLGLLRQAWQGVDSRLRWLAALLLATLVPLLASNVYVVQVAGLTGLYVILALGLNVVAGLGGLLDLGYVAFYGVGAYLYALLASPQFGLHWPFLLILPLAVAAVALLGFLLGAPSLRLRGDYLAIVTLGFGQIASLLFLNLDRVDLPFLGLAQPLNVTGGPNGIINLDSISLLGLTVRTPAGYYELILFFVALVFLAVYHLDRSRIGRAWRAIREDELAAQTMGVDVRRLKLLAFAVGGSIAGAAGVLFAAWQGSVFPPNFDVSVLIILYAMIVLGGVGSVSGAISGAVILSILPEALRSPTLARLLFYGALIGGLLYLYRRQWQRGLLILGSVAALGIVLKVLLGALEPAWFLHPQLAPSLADSALAPFFSLINAWLLFPRNSLTVGNVAFVLTVLAWLALARVKGRAREILLAPALYALIFVWETRLLADPSVTRMLILGAVLVLMMNYRPQGLFGQKWVQRT